MFKCFCTTGSHKVNALITLKVTCTHTHRHNMHSYPLSKLLSTQRETNLHSLQSQMSTAMSMPNKVTSKQCRKTKDPDLVIWPASQDLSSFKCTQPNTTETFILEQKFFFFFGDGLFCHVQERRDTLNGRTAQ